MLNMAEGGVAVVTGAAGGIGLGMSRAAAERGMAVMMCDADRDRLAASAQLLSDEGRQVALRQVDVTDPVALESLASETMAEFGRVDVVCNNAGIAGVNSIDKVTLEEWHAVINIDLNSVFYGIHAFLPVMLEQGFGHLNATASANAWRGDAFQAAYNAAKHGVAALMESVMLDLRAIEAPVTASVLSPGPIATDLMLRSVGDDEGARAEGHDALNQGMDPNKVGRITFDAIADGRFWIFTHSAIFGTIRERLEAALTTGELPPELDWPWEELFATS